uniref:Plastid division protein FtsZ n=1 Tax=Rhizochromulina marina TaxID=1034831 RepID=A0A7S2RZU4_9STRA|mmetsp:Transcript_23256/g.67863  ORF Transcript_23256/g.67863 Transcript_23256/m.67863 type:complete len:429 (+) Transcript_23256:235-1521(+)
MAAGSGTWAFRRLPALLALVWACCTPSFAFHTASLRRLGLQHRRVRSSRAATQMLGGNDAFPCNIKVIGVGGGGSNAVTRMVEYGVSGVEFVVMNTDVQALARAPSHVKTLTLGTALTGGLGAGGKPGVGQEAAEESLRDIESFVAGADMVFVTAGMGGGTGSGAAPVVAAAARRAGALTVGVVTRPFTFEGGQRRRQAVESINNLKPNVDALITIANDKLLQILPEDVALNEALECADDILRQGVVGISDIIVQPGLINVDFSDVRTVMNDAGTALMGIGSATFRDGNRARVAAERAVASPLLDVAVARAKGAVFNIVGGPDMTLAEIQESSQVIFDAMDDDANIIFGALIDERLEPGSELTVTMIATGFDADDGTSGADFGATAPTTVGGVAGAADPGAAPLRPNTAKSDLPDFLSRMRSDRPKRR